MYRILIVDDEKSMQITLRAFLMNEGYHADCAPDAMTALEMFEDGKYDVVVTDIIMPRMSGIDLLYRIREQSETTPVIIMTGEPTVDTAVKAVQSSAADYLTKPISKESFLMAVRGAAQIKQLRDEKDRLEKQNLLYQRSLESMIEKRTTALQSAMQGIISLLSSVVEIRDPYTAGHQRRVGNLSASIAHKIRLPKETAEMMRIIGYLHDIGKIVIPTEILSKPGVLSHLEMQMIQNHPLYGYEMLGKVALPDYLGETIYQHHERIDGSGYPRGLHANEIRIEAQIIAVADVVESMMSHRPYRPALGLSAALEEICDHQPKYNKDIVCACVDLFEKDRYSIDDSEHKISFPL